MPKITQGEKKKTKIFPLQEFANPSLTGRNGNYKIPSATDLQKPPLKRKCFPKVTQSPRRSSGLSVVTSKPTHERAECWDTLRRGSQQAPVSLNKSK